MHIFGYLALAFFIFLYIRGAQEDYEARRLGNVLNEVLPKKELPPAPAKHKTPELPANAWGWIAAAWFVFGLVVILYRVAQ